MPVNVSSSINPNNYDPISDLQKQYQSPLGKRVALVVKLNNGCLVPGGVETLLKSQRTSNAESSLDNIVDMRNLSIAESSGSESASANASASSFGFLNDDEQSTAASASTSVASRSRSGGRLSSFGAKLKNQFDRGVTSIAVQAHKATARDGAEIRDLLTVGAYIQNPHTGEFNVCLGMTERFEMPTPVDEDPDGDWLTFSIPILIPPHLLEENNAGAVVQFHLWMRSGAAIFSKSRALRKYLHVGSSTLRLAHLAQVTQPTFKQPAVISIPLQSAVVRLGKMTLTIVPDTKFPNLCGNGWSLSDPSTDTAYTPVLGKYPLPGKRILFNAPLDQSYAFAVSNPSKSSSTTLFTTERLTESTVVLPLAAAYTQLLSKASAISTSHAMDLASQLQCLDGADTITDPMKAMQHGHAQCQIEILHFLRYTNDGHKPAGGGTTHLTLNLQRPDSIFENCLASCTVPSHPFVQNMTYPSFPVVSIPFYPRIVDTTDPRLLPGQTTGVVAASRNVFVGKVRIQLYEEGVGGSGGDVFSPIGPTGTVGTSPRHLEAIVDIDSYLNAPNDAGVMYLNVIDLMTGGNAGALALTVSAQSLEGMVERSKGVNGSTGTDIVNGGLISLVGMDTSMEDDKACYPHSDLNSDSAAAVLAVS